MIRITKVYDYDCPICLHMGTFEGNVLFNVAAGAHFSAVEMGQLTSLDNENEHECLIAQLVERHACNPDYTVDLPIYMFTEGRTYLGHIGGEHTAAEFRTEIQKILDAAQNQTS